MTALTNLSAYEQGMLIAATAQQQIYKATICSQAISELAQAVALGKALSPQEHTIICIAVKNFSVFTTATLECNRVLTAIISNNYPECRVQATWNEQVIETQMNFNLLQLQALLRVIYPSTNIQF